MKRVNIHAKGQRARSLKDMRNEKRNISKRRSNNSNARSEQFTPSS
jgi:hypothetical protein